MGFPWVHRGVVNLAHLIHVDERVERADFDSSECTTNGETFTLVTGGAVVTEMTGRAVVVEGSGVSTRGNARMLSTVTAGMVLHVRSVSLFDG